MPNELIYLLTGLLCYFVGAIPSGYILVKLKTGKDIRTMGSGNIGATNVARVLGTKWFVPVFIFDFFKGFAPVFWLAPWVATRWHCPTCQAPMSMLAVFCALLALVGHLWPIYLGFRGGKGVATVGGILFAFNWAAALIACAVWVLVFLPFRYVSLGSVIAALSLPVAQYFTWNLVKYRWGAETVWVGTVFLGIAGILVIVRHRANLKRLIEGTEKRFGTKQA
ncbi:MAG TPA: glycerol-3-phosphate 1-O-acyltransferase PlsY [Planctomycetota bacterium]|jgi:glycerol-3-phosphate acyltransferase PlsY|nr:glycerol-3-phosphate 1-O-acyltransferase PlsY [Planctomycetota bacterium]